MKVLNIHERTLDQPPSKIMKIVDTLATDSDQIFPWEKWPKMKLDKGLAVGSKGGHGPIGYVVSKYQSGELIQFTFTQPAGFHGHHRFEIVTLGTHQVSLRHVIEMRTTWLGMIRWVLAIRWLHDALLEDLLDKVENHFEPGKTTPWNWWVQLLRTLLK